MISSGVSATVCAQDSGFHLTGELESVSNIELLKKLSPNDFGFEDWVEQARQRLFGFGDANYRIYMSKLPYVLNDPQKLRTTLSLQIEKLEESWEKIEPKYGEIDSFSDYAKSHKIAAFDPDHYQNFVSLETKESSQKVWMWDLDLNSVYVLYSEQSRYHTINEVMYSPWNSKQLVMFADYIISLLDLDWSREFKPNGIHFTSSKITKVIDLGRASQQLLFMTANGQISILGNNADSNAPANVAIMAQFEHPDAIDVLVHPYNKKQLVSYSQFEIKVWDLVEKKLVSTTNLDSTVLSGIKRPPIFLPSNPEHVLVWAEIGKLHRFDIKTAQRVNSEPTHWACARSVTDLVITKQPERLVVLCESDLLRIYDTSTLDLIETIELKNKGFKGDLALQDDRLYVWFEEASMLILLDSKNFDELGVISEDCAIDAPFQESDYFCIDPQDEMVFQDIHFYPFDQNRLVSSNGEALYFWNLDKHQMHALPIDSETPPSDVTIHMHPKNPNLILAIDKYGVLQYWDFWSQASLSFPNYPDLD